MTTTSILHVLEYWEETSPIVNLCVLQYCFSIFLVNNRLLIELYLFRVKLTTFNILVDVIGFLLALVSAFKQLKGINQPTFTQPNRVELLLSCINSYYTLMGWKSIVLDSMLISMNTYFRDLKGVFHRCRTFIEFTKFSKSAQSLKHELGPIWRSYLLSCRLRSKMLTYHKRVHPIKSFWIIKFCYWVHWIDCSAIDLTTQCVI